MFKRASRLGTQVPMDPPEGMTAPSLLNAFRSGTFSIPVCLSSAFRPRNRHTAGDWEGHPKVGVTITREPFGQKEGAPAGQGCRPGRVLFRPEPLLSVPPSSAALQSLRAPSRPGRVGLARGGPLTVPPRTRSAAPPSPLQRYRARSRPVANASRLPAPSAGPA